MKKFNHRVVEKFDPGVSRNSTSVSQEIRPQRLKKFDPSVIRKFDPCVIRKFDPSIVMIFDSAVAMIFDPAIINKFDHAVVKVIRPPRQDSSTPAEPKTSSSLRDTSTPWSQRFNDFSNR
jgi:hypothetical protein